MNLSIFIDPPILRGHTIAERISILATEKSVCEAYLKMGYSSSNGISINSRLSILDAEIKRLSDLKK